MDERGRDARPLTDRGASSIGQLEVHADEVERDDGDPRLPVVEHEGPREQIVVDARAPLNGADGRRPDGSRPPLPSDAGGVSTGNEGRARDRAYSRLCQ